MRRRRRWVVIGAGVLGAAGLGWWLRSRGRGRATSPVDGVPAHRGAERASQQGDGLERRSDPDREALRGLIDGATARVGLDLERLRKLEEANYHPLVEYLEYIQMQRGDTETLVFVRQRDVDKLAVLAGEPREDFLKRFSRLGIVLSMN
ncbi:MAG TPA: hypothetical protein VFW71_04825 [Actinomycetota bacterium]|nr:hypothetical protein [Actinomycetota bacterium]